MAGNKNPKSGWVNAKVKKYNPRQGWGFMTSPEVSRDIFVHKSTKRADGAPLVLEVGDEFQVRYRDPDRGQAFKATVIKPVSASV